MKKKVFTVGARGSALSRAQTAGALDFLRARFPDTDYRVVTVETPGDRDLTTPIEKSAPDFFTRDLDEAVRDGRIDFAIHSAKDLPPEIADDLDWFWLPERADPRDAWVVREGERPREPKIGVSSERRAAYAKKAYPKAKLLPIRGSRSRALRASTAARRRAWSSSPFRSKNSRRRKRRAISRSCSVQAMRGSWRCARIS